MAQKKLKSRRVRRRTGRKPGRKVKGTFKSPLVYSLPLELDIEKLLFGKSKKKTKGKK